MTEGPKFEARRAEVRGPKGRVVRGRGVWNEKSVSRSQMTTGSEERRALSQGGDAALSGTAIVVIASHLPYFVVILTAHAQKLQF